ncbi:MAG: DUF4199 domain-containing protein [Chitinophagaceae bacterium]
MKTRSKYYIGSRYGIVSAIFYCILLYVRFHYFATDPLSFGGFAVISYLFFLVLFYFTGRARRKQLGGYADFKEIFQAILLTIILTELAYALFNFVYLMYIEPGFFERFSTTSKINFQKAGWTDERITSQMDKLRDTYTQLSPVNALKGMGMWIVIDCIFGLIFSFALKKSKQDLQEKT